MRIAQINTDSGFGSTGTIALHLAEKLTEAGNVCRIFYGRGKPGSDKYAEKFGLDWETALHGLQTRLLGSQAQGSFISTLRLLRRLDEFQPDIVHLHNAHGYYLHLYKLLDYITRKDIPLVWTFHDAWPFTGHCTYFYDCRKWITGCRECPGRMEYPRSLLFDRSGSQWIKKCEAVQKLNRFKAVTPSRWLADAASRSFFGEKHICTVYNGIDTQTTFFPGDTLKARRDFGIPADRYILVTVAGGFSDRRKGGHHLKELTRYFAGKPVHFAAAGWKEAADALPENLTALPVISPPEKMACFYRMADAFLLLSEADNFPTVSLEALACGTPVIGFAVGGAPEQVDESTGKLVTPGQPEELEAVITQFITGACSFSGDQCRKRAEKLYSIQSMLEGYMQCYRDVIHR